MITLLLPADGRHIAQLYRLLRALLWLVLLLTVAAEWLLLDHSRLWPALPLLLLAGLWLLAARRLQQRWQLQLWLDLALLLLFFAAHGGGANPLLTLLLLPLAAAAATLGFWGWLALVAAAGGGYALLLLGLPAEPLAAHAHHGADPSHLWGMWGSFMLAAGLTGIFINRLAWRVRQQGQRLLQLHQRQGRHAMLTASGARAAAACHHLATPLNNLLLLHEHWRSAAELPPGWQADMAEMGHQLNSCLQALAPLRQQAASPPQPLAARLIQLVEEWQLVNPDCGCSLCWQPGLDADALWWPDDGLLHHALWNLMDNGRRAGGPLQLEVSAGGDGLLLTLVDQGPGFPAWLLADQQPDQPPQGLGLGVALVRTAMELCGGRLQLVNGHQQNGQGGRASLWLPWGYLQRSGDDAVAGG